MFDGKPHFILANKSDLEAKDMLEETMSSIAKRYASNMNESASERQSRPISISAKTGHGIDRLSEAIESWVFTDRRSSDSGASLNSRQGELCLRAIEALGFVQRTIEANMPQDCLATDLKTAVDCLSEICGEAVSEEIITNVFATFCIGK